MSERQFILDAFNTWYDWRLILTGKSITPPEPKYNLVNIDGMSGSLDLTEALTGEVTYKDRTISASFMATEGTYKEREALLKSIVSALHGRKIKIVEPDDPEHYYYGRVAIKSRENILPYATFTIEATCEPWRYLREETNRTIKTNSDEVISVVINNQGAKTLSPVITVKGTVKLDYGDNITTLTTGSYKITDIKFKQGITVIGVSGTGSVTFTYREADL